MEATETFLQTVGALYDETRVLLVRMIDEAGPLCVCELQASLDMTQSRLSRHLKILKDAGFLRVERKGRWAYYAIRTPMDCFRTAALEEIRTLPLDLPEVKGCDI